MLSPLQPGGGLSTVAIHGQCLTVSDHDRLRIFVNEMAIRGLFPHVERTIRALTDQVGLERIVSPFVPLAFFFFFEIIFAVLVMAFHCNASCAHSQCWLFIAQWCSVAKAKCP